MSTWLVTGGAGFIGGNFVLRAVGDGIKVVNLDALTYAGNRDTLASLDGNQQEGTEWHRVVVFGKLGEIAGDYLRKGSSVYVEGSIRYDKYTDKNGVERYTTDIIANEMQMLGGKGGGEGGGGNYERGSRPAPAQRREPAARGSAPAPAAGGFDDVPFDDGHGATGRKVTQL